MTQAEFEKGLAALKAERQSELQAIETWQVELKQKMADAHNFRTHFEGMVSRLKAERQSLASRRVEVERKWQARIEEYKAENYSETRELENISDFALVKELSKRGWHGGIWNEREDMADEHKENVAIAFSKTYAEAQVDND